MTDTHFQAATSVDDGYVRVYAQPSSYAALEPRVMVTHQCGLASFSAHLTLQQVEELSDALGDALDWVRGIPARAAADAEAARLAAGLEETERQSVSNPGEYDVPAFISGAGL